LPQQEKGQSFPCPDRGDAEKKAYFKGQLTSQLKEPAMVTG
jgi:hypothetical protein